MARGVERNGSGRAVLNPLSQTAELPQSTLAAQLVNHFTDGKKHPRNQDEETFRQLLREILGIESGQVVRAEPLETDSDVDCKLIYVIVKAGLEKAISNDSFSGKGDLSIQVNDSLIAINFTIKKNPEVLFVAPQFQGLDPRPSGPLYLWLLAKLLALVGRLQDSGTLNGVLRVLRTLLVTEKKTHITKVNLHPITKYLKGYLDGKHAHMTAFPLPLHLKSLYPVNQQLTERIEDLLSHLEAGTSDSASKSNPSLYDVPSETTLSGLWPQDQPQDVLQSALTVSFRHKRELLGTTMCLLSLFTTPSLGRPEITSNIGFNSSEDSWSLNILIRFWKAITPEGAQVDYFDSNFSSVFSFLDRIHICFAHTLRLDPLSAVSNRASTLFLQIITTYLVREPLPLPSIVEKQLCLMIFDLTLIDPKSGPKLQNSAVDALSSLFEIRKDHKRFHAFGQDLQVCTSRCLSSWLLISKLTVRYFLDTLVPREHFATEIALAASTSDATIPRSGVTANQPQIFSQFRSRYRQS